MNETKVKIDSSNIIDVTFNLFFTNNNLLRKIISDIVENKVHIDTLNTEISHSDYGKIKIEIPQSFFDSIVGMSRLYMEGSVIENIIEDIKSDFSDFTPEKINILINIISQNFMYVIIDCVLLGYMLCSSSIFYHFKTEAKKSFFDLWLEGYLPNEYYDYDINKIRDNVKVVFITAKQNFEKKNKKSKKKEVK